MFILVGLVIIIIGIGIIIANVLKKKRCTGVTSATIVDISRERNYDRGQRYGDSGFSVGSRSNISLFPIYEYQIDGVTYTQKSNQSVRMAFVGQNVELHYNPNNPQDIYTNKNIMPIIMGGIFVIFGIVFTLINVFAE